MICLSACLLSLVLGDNPPPPSGDASLGERVTARRLTPGTWLLASVSDIPPFGAVSSNALLVVGASSSVLFDTPVTVEQTDRILAWAESDLHRPIEAVLVTHAHSDRMGGVAAAVRRGLPAYAIDRTIELAPRHGFLVPGKVLPHEGALTLAGRLIEVLYPGPGHAPDNIVLWLADERVLFGGCLLKEAQSHSIGFTGDADLLGWRRALGLLQERFTHATTLVPGHGACGGPELLAHTAEIVDRAIAASSLHDGSQPQPSPPQ